MKQVLKETTKKKEEKELHRLHTYIHKKKQILK